MKIPILLVTHDLEDCFALADNVLIFEAGAIVHRGAPLELLRNPGTASVARLLGDFNLYEAEVIALDPGRQTSRLRLSAMRSTARICAGASRATGSRCERSGRASRCE